MGIDYYSVLDILRTATDLEIKRAYRRLAVKFHPSRLKNRHVEDIFNLVSEAYEVLVNPLTRAVYDQYGEEGLKSGVPTLNDGFVPPYVYHGRAMKTYREFFGTESPYADLLDILRNPLPLYDLPEGKGIKRKQDPVRHPLLLTLHELYHGGIKKMKIQRLVFRDETKSTTVLKEKILTIPIKPGLPEKTEIVFPEEGDQGPTQIPADIIFITQDRPHDVYKRNGNDLEMTEIISLPDALSCEYVVHVTTLDDRIFRVPITDVVSPDYVKIVENEGMPIVGTENKGNLIIHFEITFPLNYSIACRQALKRAFKECEKENMSSPEMINRVVLHDKMNKIEKEEQKPPV